MESQNNYDLLLLSYMLSNNIRVKAGLSIKQVPFFNSGIKIKLEKGGKKCFYNILVQNLVSY